MDALTFQNWSHEALRDAFDWSSWGDGHTAGVFRGSFSAQFLNFWRFNTAVSYTPDRVSRVATRGGPVMADPGNFGLSFGGQTDNRRRLSVSPSVSFTRGRQGVGDGVELGAAFDLQPSAQIQMSFEPSWSRADDGAQYVSTVSDPTYGETFGARYIFGDLRREDVSMVTRLNWTFTPQLTLQLYAQPLLSAGSYRSYKQLRAPGTFDFDVFEPGTAQSGIAGWSCVGGRTCRDDADGRLIDVDGDGIVDTEFTDRDFNLRSLRANAVVRWEYRPGSTVFFVWQRRQSELERTGDFAFRRDLDALWSAPGADVFMVKVNLWLTL